MKTLLFLAKGFETCEFSVFVDVLGWARDKFGLGTEVVTCAFGEEAVSTFGIPVKVDMLLEDVDPDDYDALAIPGGFASYGFYDEAYDGRLQKLIRAFDERHKIIASICVAALALGKSGVLTGRKGTTYHLDNGDKQRELAAFGVVVENERVVVDENIVTSYCPETAFDVAFQLLEMLTSRPQANAVRQAMGFSER